MNPLSHTTYTTSAATGQLGENVEPPIANLPDEVLVTSIFPYLGSKDLSHASQVCQRFNILGRTTWQRRAQELCQTCSKRFLSFGITPLGPNPSRAEVALFLRETTRRVVEINTALPKNVQSPCSADDLVCKVGPGHMQEFLQTAYDHSLRAMFGELAHVPEGASLEESVRLVREWLQTAEVRKILELRLGNCGLCCIPREIGQLAALEGLFLSDNQLNPLPPEIGQLKLLQWLYLRNSHLTALPPEIGQLTALQWLYLDGNQIASLPPEIGQLTMLRGVFLSDNQLASLPPEIGRLTALQWLDLSRNQLTSLPPEIGRLTALLELDMGSNGLTSFPPEIGQLVALHKLDLSSNRLTSLPPEVGQLSALHVLDLGENVLTSLPPEIEQLTTLQVLALKNNPLVSLLPGNEQLTAPR